jgi:hypothetical protein
MARVTSAVTAATTAAVKNPRENPAELVPARLVAALLETTAAPNSWKVLTIPEARPASCGATWPSGGVYLDTVRDMLGRRAFSTAADDCDLWIEERTDELEARGAASMVFDHLVDSES